MHYETVLPLLHESYGRKYWSDRLWGMIEPFLTCNSMHLSFHLQQCKLKCKQPCTYWQYQKSVSYARFPSDGARFFVTNDTEWSNLHQTIILDVFYTMLEHTVIRHVRTM
jgi:hypothetical protein